MASHPRTTRPEWLPPDDESDTSTTDYEVRPLEKATMTISIVLLTSSLHVFDALIDNFHRRRCSRTAHELFLAPARTTHPRTSHTKAGEFPSFPAARMRTDSHRSTPDAMNAEWLTEVVAEEQDYQSGSSDGRVSPVCLLSFVIVFLSCEYCYR